MTKISEGNHEQQSQSSQSSSSSVTQNGATIGFPSPKCLSENKVKKSSPNGHNKLDAATHEEMQSLLAKLKELVPNMPRNKKLSKLEIIQYVIDYIFDLQLALESHPTHTITKPHNTCIIPSNTSPNNRQPLGLLSPSAIIN